MKRRFEYLRTGQKHTPIVAQAPLALEAPQFENMEQRVLMSVTLASQDFNSLTGLTPTTETIAATSVDVALTTAGTFNSGSGGLDFQTLWTDTRGNAGPKTPTSDTSDFIGVNDFSGSNAPDVAADGTAVSSSEKNFEFNDGDGRLSLTFDAVDFSGYINRTISLNYWITSTGYESDDAFSVVVSDGVSDITVLNFGEPELEANGSADDGTANWKSLNIDVSALALGDNITLKVNADTNSGSENIFVDNILFTGDLASQSVDATKTLFAQGAIHTSGDNFSSDYYGSGNDDGFSEFGIASFSFTRADFGLSGGDTITNVTTADYTLTHNDRSFSDGTQVEFFLTMDQYAGNFAGLSFNAGLVNGVDASQFSFAPVSLGQFAYTPDAGGVEQTFSLDLSVLNSNVINALNNGLEFNIIIAAVTADADVTFSGLNNQFDPGDPRLKLTVDAQQGADTFAPTATSFNPSDESIDVGITGNLSISFDETVVLNSGNITLFDASDDSIIETIDVTTAAAAANGSVVTLNPVSDLPYSTDIYVQIDGTAIEDTAGNAFAGIADKTTWNFTTEDAPDLLPPSVIDLVVNVSRNSAAGTIVADLNADDGLGDDINVLYAILAGSGSDASMMLGENGYAVTPTLTVGQTLKNTTGALNSTTAGDYTPIGILDGIGAMALDANTVRIFVNHETGSSLAGSYQLENGTVIPSGARISYFDIDKSSRAIIDGGLAYGTVYDRAGNIVTNVNQLDTVGFDRFCSSVLVEAEQFGLNRGLVDTIYFTGEESSTDFGHPHGGTEWALEVATGELWALPDFGRGSWENITEVDTGTTTHVAFLLGDDAVGRPAYLYVGQKDTSVGANFVERNGLKGGQLYFWKSDSGETDPSTFNTSGTLNGSWIAIDPQDVAMAGQPGYDALGYKDDFTMLAEVTGNGGFEFSRPEDVATNPNNGAQVIMASTGRQGFAGDADVVGTMYRFDLDFTNLNAPTSTLTIVYDGDADPSQALRSPDNLDWADDGFVYIQEDRAAGGLFGAGAANPNEASILKMDPFTGTISRVAEINRNTVLPLGSTDNDPNDVGDWESSGILDVSTLFGEAPGTLFLFDVQAHSVRDGIIGGNGGLVQGGQLSFLELGGETDAFDINLNNGIITVNNPDALKQANGPFILDVQANDGSNNSAFARVTINLTDDAVEDDTEIRFATYNAALSSRGEGGLINDLSDLNDSQAQAIAEVIQINNPDVLLINEFDYDAAGQAIDLFRENYLEVSQDGNDPVFYPYVYFAPSNTGIDSGFDLDNNGTVGGAGDAFGFGNYEGEFGMVILSKYEILNDSVRTFQNFLWKDMPGALLPEDPNDADNNGDLANWYTPAELDVVRLSSKSHWDVPILVNGNVVHVLASHPTPPVFDGAEDRNGTRNHDEIRFWADYITPGAGGYIYDDNGNFGQLGADDKFVIMGDMNADPFDGDSTNNAIDQLLSNANINTSVTPSSLGGVENADSGHIGDPAFDTSDFGSNPGNLRVDYVLPSDDLQILNAEVFWPESSDPDSVPASASDHRMVVVDMKLERPEDPKNEIIGTRHDDLLIGTREDDLIKGRKGDDILIGGKGDDDLLGQKGDDLLLGGFGNDLLKGGKGDDILAGGFGDDTLVGGQGDDVFVVGLFGGNDTILDFQSGQDKIKLIGLLVKSITEVNPGEFTVDFWFGGQTLTVFGGSLQLSDFI